jgi:hypothetical protein
MDDLDAGQPAEELSFGARSRRREGVLLVGALVVLVAAASVTGWRVGRDGRHSAPSARPAAHGAKLVIGALVANRPNDFQGPEFVATVHNVGDRPARVTNIAPRQWQATNPPVMVPAGGSIEVPVDATIDCRYTPPPTDEVLVRMTSSGRGMVQVMQLPSIPGALSEKWERMCAIPVGRTPRRDELVGVWIVDRADFFAGQMLIDLRADGTWAMDPFTTLFTNPGARGGYSYRAGRLLLDTRGGQDCAGGGHSLWRVGLLSDGRLRMQILNQYDSVCTIETGEVWIARRVSRPSLS